MDTTRTRLKPIKLVDDTYEYVAYVLSIVPPIPMVVILILSWGFNH